MPFKIKSKLLIGFFAMILPLLALLPVIHNKHSQIVEANLRAMMIAEDMGLISLLSTAVMDLAMPPNDYLITGDVTERDKYNVAMKGMDTVFQRLERRIGGWDSNSSDIVKNTKAMFPEINSLALDILHIPDPKGSKKGVFLMKRLDALEHRIVGFMEILHRERMKGLEVSLKNNSDAAEKEWRSVVEAVVLLSLLGIFFSLYYTRLFVDPIKALHRGAEIIAAGDFSHRLKVETGDEISQLASEFNEMAEKIAELYDVLEERVQERTKELHKAVVDAKRSRDTLKKRDLELSGTNEALRRRVDELERFKKATIQREFRIKELREKVSQLEHKLGGR